LALIILKNWQLIQRRRPPGIKKLVYFGYDREVFMVALPAVMRSGVSKFSHLGPLQLSAMLATKATDLDFASSYIFSVRVVQILMTFSNVPIMSNLPVILHRHHRGDGAYVGAFFVQRIPLSILLFLGLFVCVTISFPVIAGYLDFKTSLAPSFTWLSLGLSALILQASNLCMHPVAMVNTYPFVRTWVMSFVASCLLLFFCGGLFESKVLLIFTVATYGIFQNIRPIKYAGSHALLEMVSVQRLLNRVLIVTAVSSVLMIGFVILTNSVMVR
jgi:hypothetical protein